MPHQGEEKAAYIKAGLSPSGWEMTVGPYDGLIFPFRNAAQPFGGVCAVEFP